LVSKNNKERYEMFGGIKIPFLCFSLAPKGRGHRISEQNTSKGKNVYLGDFEPISSSYRDEMTASCHK